MEKYRESIELAERITRYLEGKLSDTMCAGIDFMRRFLGGSLLEHETNVLTAEKFCFDADNNIYYTPAFRKTNSCYTAGLGISSMIYALKLRFL